MPTNETSIVRKIKTAMHSMRAKLTLWYTGILALVLIAFAAATYIYFVRASGQKTDDALMDSSDLVVASLKTELAEANEQGTQTVREVVNDFRFRDREVVVFDENHQVVASSEPRDKERNRRTWPRPESFANLPGLTSGPGRACSTLTPGHGIRFCGVVLQSTSGTFLIVTA